MQDVSTLILRPETDGEPAIPIHISLTEAGIPEHLQPGLIRYLLEGIRPGDMLQGVLKNNLTEAMTRYSGDANDIRKLVMWLLNCVPAPCWGSPGDVERWITRKALERAPRADQ